MTDRAVKIDQDLGTEEPVQCLLSCGMAAHEPLERGRLIGREVIDVKVRVVLKPGTDKINEAFERLFLIRPRKHPIGGVIQLPIGAAIGVPEEVLQPAFPCEGITFEIKKHITWRGFGQHREAKAWLKGQELVKNAAGIPAFNLDPGLLPNPLIGMSGPTLRLPRERERHCSQLRDRPDGLLLEFFRLKL